jgi:hypothetical protein
VSVRAECGARISRGCESAGACLSCKMRPLQGDTILHTADRSIAASPRARGPIGAAVLFSAEPDAQRAVVMLWAHTAAQATRHGAHRPTHKHTPRRAARIWFSGVSAVPVQMWPMMVSTHVRTHLRSLRRERQLRPVLWFGLPRVVQLRDHLSQRVHNLPPGMAYNMQRATWHGVQHATCHLAWRTTCNVPPGMAYNMQRATRRTTYTCRTV